MVAFSPLGACTDGSSSHGGSSRDAAKPSGTTVGKAPSSAGKYEQISTTLFVFDTVVTIAACCSQQTLDALADRCTYFESIFSRTLPTSDVGQINAAGGQPVNVAPETADIIMKALSYCEESDGLFDITIGVATSLWDFKAGVKPLPDAVAEAVTHIDYRKVKVNGTLVQLEDPAAMIDLGGIAKGYIADDLCRMLIDAGCDSGFVNLGGNVKTVGVRPDGRAWRVGIQDPNNANGTVIAAVDSQDASVVTSGLYEREFSDAEGNRYWHILDPRTGYPVQTDVMSATIMSDASIDGDGFTKLLFFLGAQRALAWLESRKEIEGIVVDTEGSIAQTSGCGAVLA